MTRNMYNKLKRVCNTREIANASFGFPINETKQLRSVTNPKEVRRRKESMQTKRTTFFRSETSDRKQNEKRERLSADPKMRTIGRPLIQHLKKKREKGRTFLRREQKIIKRETACKKRSRIPKVKVFQQRGREDVYLSQQLFFCVCFLEFGEERRKTMKKLNQKRHSVVNEPIVADTLQVPSRAGEEKKNRITDD